MALTAAQIQEQKKQAEELLFAGPETLGFGKGLFFGHFNAKLVFPYPEVDPAERPALEKSLADLRRFANDKIDAAAIDRNADIPVGSHCRPGGARRLGHGGPACLRRPGLLAVRLLQNHGSDRRPLRFHGCLRQRASFHRHPRPGPVRHRRTKKPLAARSGHRQEAGRLRADRTGSRLRRRQRADEGRPQRRRQNLFPHRRKALHHQRRHRPSPHRDGPHAHSQFQRYRRHRLSGHARHARLRGRRSPHAQVRHPRHRHRPPRLSQHAGSRRKYPGSVRQGSARRPDGARFWPHHFWRQLHRRRQDLSSGRRAACQRTRAVQGNPRRIRADQEEDRRRWPPIPSPWKRPP